MLLTHPVARHFVNADGRQAHLRRAGSGPAVVLLHDTPRSSESLLDLIQALAHACTVVALDLPGYGGSEGLGKTAPSISDYAAATLTVLGALGITRCVLYGEGVGGCVAAEIAARAPGLVAAVVVCGARARATPCSEADFARHNPPLVPAYDGTHLVRHWAALRDAYIFSPWWDRRPQTRVYGDVPDADALNRMLLDVLRAGPAYADGMRAAGGYDIAGRLAQLGSRAHEVDQGATARHAAILATLARDIPPPPPVPARQDRPGRLSRAYVDTPYGQTLMRFREEAPGRPVILLHASPISGFTLEGLLDGMAASRPVYALDTIANGESDKPDLAVHPHWAHPSLTHFADWLIAVIDELGFDQVDLFGSHTGAMIALEAAIRAPHRVASLVLDGVVMNTDAENADILAGYFPDIRPRWDGAHLLTCWLQQQDVTLWNPWMSRDAAHVSTFPIILASQIHEHVTEMLKRGEWHERCYRPVFEYPTAENLPRLTTRTLFATPQDDYLEKFSAAAAALARNARSGSAPRSTTFSDRYYAPFVPDAAIAEFYLGIFNEDAG